MKTWLIQTWDELRTNFWFVPTLMVVASILLSFLTLAVDHATGVDALGLSALIYSRGPEGSRALLSAVASSMITIASLTFSITIVTLQLASSQFGPRLLRNFVRDRGNQVVLGTFIATFAYCLLVLRTVNGTESHEFVPHVSVLVAMLMSLAALGVLIYFIHHTAVSIQVETVVASVACELEEGLDGLFPESVGRDSDAAGVPAAEPARLARDGAPIPAPASGYLQAVDGDGLLAAAAARDLVVTLAYRPGEFVVAGREIARAWPPNRLDEPACRDLRRAFVVGIRRTLTQDPGFAIDQLVEIALRALSPGINDPFTALASVDRLAAAFRRVAGRPAPSPHRLDGEGRLRVVAPPWDLSDLLGRAFHPLRRAARSHAAVAHALLRAFAIVAEATPADDSSRAVLLQLAALVHEDGRDTFLNDFDRAEAAAAHEAVLRAAGVASV